MQRRNFHTGGSSPKWATGPAQVKSGTPSPPHLHPNELPSGIRRQRSNQLIKLKTIQNTRNKRPRRELRSYPKIGEQDSYGIWCVKQKCRAKEMRVDAGESGADREGGDSKEYPIAVMSIHCCF